MSNQDTRDNLSKKNKGKKLSEEHKRKISKSNMGRKGCWLGKEFSQEMCKNISKAKLGKKNGMFGKKHSDKTKIAMSKSQKRRWESEEFKNLPHERKEEKLWGFLVRDRANYKCENCNAANDKLHAHHIKPKKQFPSMRFDVDNGILLCVDCHVEAHKVLGQDYLEGLIRRI